MEIEDLSIFCTSTEPFFGLYNLMNDLGANVLVNNYKTLKK